jgi:hypothetical protein
LPDEIVMTALEPFDDHWHALHPNIRSTKYRQCENYATHNVCNWMVPLEDSNPLCYSCRLNKIIPDLNYPENIRLWCRIENAKRRCLYTVLDLGLPIVSYQENPKTGLAFEFMADSDTSSEFIDLYSSKNSIITGHRSGTITINIAEANPSAREEMREKMNELYRTLLGHFRHEIGHYFWMLLVTNTKWLQPARELFGDETQDYTRALKEYYANGPPADWAENYISAYASVHPWEDWAETWAHYMHIVDTLQTASDSGFTLHGAPVSSPADMMNEQSQYSQSPEVARATFDNLLHDWINLTIALNALNRSMGIQDVYPFVLTKRISEKLKFIHQIVQHVVAS